MAGLIKKRKQIRSLESSTKRLRIETATEYEEHFDDEELESEYLDLQDDSSEEGESQVADTPITPISPPRKFPSERKTIKCTFPGCDKTFNRPVRLTAHLRSHTNERPFICNHSGCDKSYMQEKHLIAHTKGSHTHERNYQCDWEGCTKSFLTATRLRRHQDAHGGRERFRCTSYPPCNQTFRKHQTLQRHIRSEHLELAPFPCAYIDPATKLPCDAGFDSGGALRKHEDRIHGALRFWCDECSTDESEHSGFSTKAELTKHIRKEHANCIFCDLKCSSQSELQQHIEKHHQQPSPKAPLANRKTILCTEPNCTKTFTKNYNLSVHIRTAHNGERFMCGQQVASKSPDLSSWDSRNGCGKTFVSKVNLEDHIRTQHLELSSVVNAKRIKKNKKDKKDKKEKVKDQTQDFIGLLTGTAYQQNPQRNISCSVTSCKWLFTRDYDLQVHLRAKHGLGAETENEQSESLGQLYPEDVEWEMQRRASAGEPFWIGADDNADGGGERDEDVWIKEAEEMRRLIDLDGSADTEFSMFVDPALRGV